MRFMSIVGRLAFAAFLISLVVGLVAAFGTRFHAWNYQVGFLQLFPFCLYAGAAGLALGAVWGIAALYLNAGTASNYGVGGLLGSLAIIVVPLYTLYEVNIAHAIPPIHDISTDTEHPPQFVALLHDRPGATNPPDYDGPKLVRTYDGKIRTTAEVQKLYYFDIKPVPFLGATAASVYQRALRAAGAMGWRIVAAVPSKDGGRIEATDTSFFFGFKDDIVIRVRPAGKMGAHLDIRSKSRIGESDLGANAAHIHAYEKKLANT
jgi:uncharacterized protein (DUF1499 family)